MSNVHSSLRRLLLQEIENVLKEQAIDPIDLESEYLRRLELAREGDPRYSSLLLPSPEGRRSGFRGYRSARYEGEETFEGENDAAREYHDIIRRASQTYGVPTDLIHAVTSLESGYRPRVLSSAGARGMMQLMPGTARDLGLQVDDFYDSGEPNSPGRSSRGRIDNSAEAERLLQRYGDQEPADERTDPELNIMAGTRYLRQMLDRFDGRTDLALSAYNAGPGSRRGTSTRGLRGANRGRSIDDIDNWVVHPGTTSYVDRIQRRLDSLESDRTVSDRISSSRDAASRSVRQREREIEATIPPDRAVRDIPPDMRVWDDEYSGASDSDSWMAGLSDAEKRRLAAIPYPNPSVEADRERQRALRGDEIQPWIGSREYEQAIAAGEEPKYPEVTRDIMPFTAVQSTAIEQGRPDPAQTYTPSPAMTSRREQEQREQEAVIRREQEQAARETSTKPPSRLVTDFGDNITSVYTPQDPIRYAWDDPGDAEDRAVRHAARTGQISPTQLSDYESLRATGWDPTGRSNLSENVDLKHKIETLIEEFFKNLNIS